MIELFKFFQDSWYKKNQIECTYCNESAIIRIKSKKSDTTKSANIPTCMHHGGVIAHALVGFANHNLIEVEYI